MGYKIYELITNNFKIEVFKSTNLIKIELHNIIKNCMFLNYEIFVESNNFYISHTQYPSLVIKNIITLFTTNKIELHNKLGDVCKIDEIEHILELLNCKEELKLLDEKHKNDFINNIYERINSFKIEISIYEKKIENYLKSYE